MGTVVRRDPGNHGLLTGSWGVSARSEDREGAEEGGVGLLEEAAEGCGGVFRAEDRGEGCEPLEVVCSGCRREGAVKDDVVPRVAPGNAVWVWGLGEVARTFRGVVGPLAEAVGVVSIEAVGDGEAEDGGAYKTVFVGDGCLNGGWGFVTVWWGAGDVGWVVGRGVIPLDAGPHGTPTS